MGRLNVWSVMKHDDLSVRNSGISPPRTSKRAFRGRSDFEKFLLVIDVSPAHALLLYT